MALNRGGALHIDKDRRLLVSGELVDVKMVIQSLLRGTTLREAVHLNLVEGHFLQI